MRDKKYRIHDIAEKAGVSPATVSRVINHRNLVNRGTIDKVESVMKQLGYNPGSPIIEKNSKDVILVNCPQGINPFYEEIIRGAITSASAHGFYIILNYDPINKNTINNFLDLIKKINASGVILLSYLSVELLESIYSICPLVQCCEYNNDSPLPHVSIDDYSAAKNVVQFLVSAGRNKIAILNGPTTDFKYARERLRGFLDGMRENNLTVPSSWIAEVPQINFDMAYTIISQMLTSNPLPNAIFAASDVLAAAIINAAGKRKLNIPGDLMVIGFDNLDICRMVHPAITTVNQPKIQMGYTACEILIECITGKGTQPRSMLLSTELIIRESAVSQVNHSSLINSHTGY